MTKAELVKAIAAQTGIEAVTVATVVEQMMEEIRQSMIGGENDLPARFREFHPQTPCAEGGAEHRQEHVDHDPRTQHSGFQAVEGVHGQSEVGGCHESCDSSSRRRAIPHGLLLFPAGPAGALRRAAAVARHRESRRFRRAVRKSSPTRWGWAAGFSLTLAIFGGVVLFGRIHRRRLLPAGAHPDDLHHVRRAVRRPRRRSLRREGTRRDLPLGLRPDVYFGTRRLCARPPDRRAAPQLANATQTPTGPSNDGPVAYLRGRRTLRPKRLPVVGSLISSDAPDHWLIL